VIIFVHFWRNTQSKDDRVDMGSAGGGWDVGLDLDLPVDSEPVESKPGAYTRTWLFSRVLQLLGLCWQFY
jgi:hypothetical protein